MKRRISSIALLSLLVIALAVIPVLALTVSAADDIFLITGDGNESYADKFSGDVLPGAGNIPDGYTFAGWTDVEIASETTAKPTIYPEGASVPEGVVKLYAVYTRNVTVSGPTTTTWKLVTNASELKEGDVVVIAASSTNVALSTTQNKNNRGQTSITKNNTTKTISTPSASVQQLTLKLGNQANTWAFYTGSGYLHAASSSNNYLKTETNLSNNSSFSIEIASTGVATIKAQGSYTRNLLRYNSQSSLFACYGSGQQDICLYKKTTVSTSTTVNYYKTVIAPEISCEHINTEHFYNEPTNTEPGSEGEICLDCGETLSETVIPALGWNASFVAPGANIEGVEGKFTATMPDAVEVSNIYTFAGWATSEVAGTTTAPKLYQPGEVVNLNGHTTFYAVYSYVSTVKETGYVKKDLADIAATDVVVIVASKDSTSWALHNDNGTGSAPTAVAVTVNGDRLTGTIADTIKWNITNNNGNLTIYPNGTTDTWLYCTSTNNGVRVGTNTANVFKMDASGYLKHTGTSRYLGVYTTNPDWRCYTSTTTNIGGQTFSFFTIGGETEVITYTTNVETKISGAQLQIEDTLVIKYLVTVGDGLNIDDFKIKFTYGLNADKELIVDDCVDNNDGRYAFLFTGIAPQSMSDNIKAELMYGDEVVDILAEYSVKQYAANMIKEYSDNTKLVELLSDMLHYGAEAQLYLGYNTNNLANEGVDGILDAKTGIVPDDANVKAEEVIDDTNVDITAAGVRFDYNNKVYIRFTIKDIDISNVKVYIGDAEAEIVEDNGVYTVYSDGILASEHSKPQVFEIAVNGEVVVTATYSVNSYAYSKGNGETKIAPLAKAMYYYGLAAENYSANN